MAKRLKLGQLEKHQVRCLCHLLNGRRFPHQSWFDEVVLGSIGHIVSRVRAGTAGVPGCVFHALSPKCEDGCGGESNPLAAFCLPHYA